MQTDNANLKGTTEIKQAFLASAISDISSYIQLSDTKVSIIMAAMVALVAAVMSRFYVLWTRSSHVVGWGLLS